MGQRSVTRQVPRLSMRASFDTSTVNVEKRTVDVIWTTGAAVMRGGGWSDPYWEELSLDPKHVRMERLQSGTAPFLNAHSSYSLSDVLGVVETASLTKKSGTATVRFAKGPVGDDVLSKVADGILRNISVGYQTYEMQKVKGGVDTTDRFLATDWEPYEISLVPIGADAGAVTRSAGAMTPCVFIEERAMEDDETTTKPAPAVTTAPAVAPAPAPSAVSGASHEVRSAEKLRISGIYRVARTLKRPEAEAEAAIESDLSLDGYRAKALDAHADAPPLDGGVITFDKRDARIQPGLDQADKRRTAGTNWLLLRAGLSELINEAATKQGKKVDLDPGEYRGMTLVEMARDSLTHAGVKSRGMDVMQMIGLAFTHRSGGMNSTSDFPVLLETAMNKTLLAAYETIDDTWREFCAIGSVPDFRPSNRYRQGSFAVLDTVLEGGEYKDASIPDGLKQQISATTKGRIVALTRQAIINDDLSAFSNIAAGLGRAAARTVETDVYALLAQNGGNGPTMPDGYALFSAQHGNLGAGSALGVTALDADRVLLGSQQDISKNDYLALRPSIMLVGLGLGGQARVINTSQYSTDKVANGRNQEPNMVVGLFKNIIDTPRISGTTRYLFADPDIAPVIEVVFLNGNQNPYLETKEGWRVDGTEWKVRLDSGVGVRDYVGAVKNAGA